MVDQAGRFRPGEKISHGLVDSRRTMVDVLGGIQYSYPGKDYDDLMAGVDASVAKGWIDDKNLFVCGGSGGGVLTAWIVGKTDRVAAAVLMRPGENWHPFVGPTDGPK